MLIGFFLLKYESNGLPCSLELIIKSIGIRNWFKKSKIVGSNDKQWPQSDHHLLSLISFNYSNIIFAQHTNKFQLINYKNFVSFHIRETVVSKSEFRNLNHQIFLLSNLFHVYNEAWC